METVLKLILSLLLLFCSVSQASAGGAEIGNIDGGLYGDEPSPMVDGDEPLDGWIDIEGLPLEDLLELQELLAGVELEVVEFQDGDDIHLD